MPLALPPGLHADVAGVHLDAAFALGAQALVYVGDASDVTRYDPVATETVRVVPAAVSVTVTRPLGGVDAWAALRMEEGTVHAGGLEAAEARVGVTRGGWLGAWVGRADLPLSFDREYEAEDLTFSVRPLLSRAVLPLHATGAGLTVDGLGAARCRRSAVPAAAAFAR